MNDTHLQIAPFRGLRFQLPKLGGQGGGKLPEVTAPPYDVISPEEHRRLLKSSDHNITRLTLGSVPGEASSYRERGALFSLWRQSGVLVADPEPCFYVYVVDYPVPGEASRRARMLGLIAVARLRPFEDRIILPHEQTFPRVVEDRRRLLEETRANLESIFLLYADSKREIDAILDEHSRGEAAVSVEAKPGETHAIYPVSDVKTGIELTELMRRQRPIIADGHHRYTTSLRYHRDARERGETIPGAGWQMMTFTNLYSPGLAILATHRLVKLENGDASAVVERLRRRLEPAGDGDWDYSVELRGGARHGFRIPQGVRASRTGVAATNYALLHDVVLGEWLRPWLAAEPEIQYFKDCTGEDEALAAGKGDLLFRMRPVERGEFQRVVSGGEVFPHKTTYFYPKLWSGLVLWALEEPEPLALK